VPVENGVELVVPAGYKVLLEAILPDGLRRMSAYVLARREGNRPGLVLDWPQTDERVQRRDNVRVSVMFPVYVRPVENSGKVGKRINGTAVDLSAGGVRLSLPEPLWEGAFVEMALQIPELGERICAGRVMRAAENPNAGLAGLYSAGVQFVEISEIVRRDITRFVFDTQREHFRKGGV
jgi:c-di-GMP-binding flagellar brake protein YcgR